MTARACILGCLGPQLSSEESAYLREADPWGFIIFGRNIQTPNQVRRLTSDLREPVGRDAPILIDQEGGRVARFSAPHWRKWVPALEFSQAYGVNAEEAMYLRGRMIADDLHCVGIDVNCAPMLDLANADSHHVILNRCYGYEAETVAVNGRALANGQLDGGVLSVIKHIPGHGRANLDSHFDLPKIDHIRRPSSINSSSFGISEIRGLKLESDGDQKLVPMLVRWDNQILPTLTLASILKSQRLKSGDLILEKDGYLRLGSESVILKLDQKGRAALPSNEQEQKSASTLQIYPEQAETYKIITPSSAPKSTYGLEGQIRQALSQKAVHKLTYKRWSLPFELALLLTIVSLLHIRRIWIEPLILVCVIGGSVLAGKWMLLSPLVLIIITFHLCPRGSSPRQKH